MKTQIKLRSTALALALSALAGLGIRAPASADEAKLASNAPPRVLISAHVAILDDATTKSLATGWVFGGMGSDRLRFIDFDSERSEGKMAAVLTTSHVLQTMSALEHRHLMHSFPTPTGGITAKTGQDLEIPLDKGESLAVTPRVSADGLSVKLDITARLRELGIDGEESLYRTSLISIIRDGQGVVVAALRRSEWRTPAEGGSKILLVRARIVDETGKPVHEWDELSTRPGTRFYWDKKPYAHPAIPPQSPGPDH